MRFGHMLIQCVGRNPFSGGSIFCLRPVSSITAAHISLQQVFEFRRLNRTLLRFTMSFPIRLARASAFSVRPARMSLFFRRNLALMAGVI